MTCLTTIHRFTFAAALLGLPASAWAERPEQIDTTRSDDVVLSYRFERGQAARYEISALQQIEVLDSRQPIAAVSELTVPLAFEVQAVADDGTATITTSLGDPQLNVVSSTDGDVDTSELRTVLRSARFSQDIRPDGTVIDEAVTFPELDSLALDSAVSIVDDALSTNWISFPAEPVKIGDSWLQTITESTHEGQLQSTITVQYTLAGFALVDEREQAVIDATYTFRIEGTVLSGENNVRETRLVGRGQGTGYMIFDHQRGSLTESSSDSGLVLAADETGGRRHTTAFSTVVRMTGAN